MSNHTFPEPKSPPTWVWIAMVALTACVMIGSPPKISSWPTSTPQGLPPALAASR